MAYSANAAVSQFPAYNVEPSGKALYGLLQPLVPDHFFQVTIANPVFTVPSNTTENRVMCNDVDVKAGVEILGSVRRPTINLVSTPEVSEAEKLSWIVFGRS